MSIRGEQEFSTEIEATPEQCFDVIVDFEAYPKWASGITSARVLERDREGVGRRVEFVIEIPLRKIRYVLEYDYRRPNRLTWRSVDGDVRSIQGEYRFRKKGKRSTEATCRQAIDLGFWLPGPVRRILEQGALQRSVLEFRDEVHRRGTSDSTG